MVGSWTRSGTPRTWTGARIEYWQGRFYLLCPSAGLCCDHLLSFFEHLLCSSALLLVYTGSKWLYPQPCYHLIHFLPILGQHLSILRTEDSFTLYLLYVWSQLAGYCKMPSHKSVRKEIDGVGLPFMMSFDAFKWLCLTTATSQSFYSQYVNYGS